VGVARSYFKPDSTLSYAGYIKAIKAGRSYVSEGNSHIIDFKVNGVESGTSNSELHLTAVQSVTIQAKAVALLPVKQDEYGYTIAQRPIDRQPYWHIERARIGKTRKVPVELIVNGIAVDTAEMVADGQWKDIRFNYTMNEPGWVALRIYPSAHSNPVFVTMNNQHVQIKKSAAWCMRALRQCWKMKQGNIRPAERATAEAAYNSAEKVYEKIMKEGY
jgi:hypothetical protein